MDLSKYSSKYYTIGKGEKPCENSQITKISAIILLCALVLYVTCVFAVSSWIFPFFS